MFARDDKWVWQSAVEGIWGSVIDALTEGIGVCVDVGVADVIARAVLEVDDGVEIAVR